MIDLLWWHWALVGFGFILAELALPAFVLVWFGLGGFIVMIAMLLAPSLSLAMQLLVWTLSSLGMMMIWFRVFKRGAYKVLIGRSSAALVGEVGMIAQAVGPFKPGKVRFQKPIIGSDLWSCTSEQDIIAGTRVRVESVEGNTVIVKKLED